MKSILEKLSYAVKSAIKPMQYYAILVKRIVIVELKV